MTEEEKLQNPELVIEVGSEGNTPPVSTGSTTGNDAPPIDHFQRMKKLKRFQDKDYDSHETALADAISAIEELEPQSEEAVKFKEDMTKLLTEKPELAYVIQQSAKGVGLIPALHGLHDNPEDMLIREGDEDWDKVEEMRKSRIERDNMFDNLNAEYQKNAENFGSMYEGWSSTKGMDDNDKGNFLGYLSDLSEKLAKGAISEQELDELYKAYRYDGDITAIDEDMKIASANQQPEVAPNQEELLPIPAGSSPPAQAPQAPKKKNALDELQEAGMLK
jgi:hypothetical protein